MRRQDWKEDIWKLGELNVIKQYDVNLGRVVYSPPV